MDRNTTDFAQELAELQKRFEKLTRRCQDLESRLLHIENSLLFRLVRWPGRILVAWKQRLGHTLLHSPFHPLYLKLTGAETAARQYRLWLQRQASSTPPNDWFCNRAHQCRRRPLISIVMPVHNPRREWLQAAVESVLNQSYDRWELCVCDDASSLAPWVEDYFRRLSGGEPRIRFIRAGGKLGIAGASNLAGTLATGEYVGFLDQDDLLSPHALYHVATALQQSDADLIYSDEDHLEGDSRTEPIFKPAWSPDLLLCCMYFGHFLVVGKSALDRAHWLQPGFDGSQDYDLALRLTDSGAVVRHIPRILYHWRKHPGSTALSNTAKPYTHTAGFAALANAVQRRQWAADVADGPVANSYRVRWHNSADWKASLIIVSRNPRLLAKCLSAIERHTAYANRELIIVHHKNGDQDAEMEQLLERTPATRLVYFGEFNFSTINNLGAGSATGQALIFLNDDVEPLDDGWLDELMAHVERPDVAIAGARLLYPRGAIQHAGLAVGIMQGAGHIYRDTFGSEWWKWLPFTRDVAAVTGACLAIRHTVFQELGGFDPDFPVNYNDADLCLRARQLGYRVVFEPAARLRHSECQTRTPGVRFEERERWEERWGEFLARGDPFYSAWLTKVRENCSLDVSQDGSSIPDFR